MPLFAEADQSTSLLSLAMITISTLGAFGTAVVALLAARDKLRYAAEIVQLRSDVAAITVRMQECHDEKEQMRVERDADRAELVELRRLLTGRSGPLTSLPPDQPK